VDWIQKAEQLPIGGTDRTDCPDCGLGTNTNAAMVNRSSKGFSIFCHACDYKWFKPTGPLTIKEIARLKELNADAAAPQPLRLPEDLSDDIPLNGRMWLYKAGIRAKDIKRYRIGFSKSFGRVILPVYRKGKLIWYQSRAVYDGQKPKYIQPSRDKSSVYFLGGTHKDMSRIIVVEDILSAIRVGNIAPTFCVLGTKLSTVQAEFLSRYDMVTTWLDNDKAGINGARKIRQSLGLVTEVSNITTEHDPKFYSDEEIQEILNG